MKSYKLSFCIPVYNFEEAANKLVTDLLDNKSDRFQVVISDNASTDGTVSRLKRIRDPRLKLCVNTENIGAKLNWCQVLEQGDGEWLYLVMGRDSLNARKINELLAFLDELAGERVGCITDRKTYGKKVILNQYESVTLFLKAGEHPTGAIFNKDAFWAIKDRKKYFMMAFTYPEIYLMRDILVNYYGAVSNVGLYTGKVNIDKRKVKSNYERDKKVLYYYPSKRTEQFIHVIKMVEFDRRFSFSNAEFDDFFILRYKELLILVTDAWKKNNKDVKWTAHYNREKREVTKWEQIWNVAAAWRAVTHVYGKRFSIKRKMYMLSFSVRKILNIIVQ